MNTLLQQAAQAFLFFALCFTSGSYVDLSGKLLQEAASEAALQIILMECLVWDTLSELCEKRFSPHLCVGFLFLILYPAASSSSASAASAFTLSHTIFHTQLCHTPSFTPPSFTHNFVTHHLSPHHLSRATLSHTIFHHTIFHAQLCHTHTQLCHTPSFTHNFVTHHLSPHHLSHTTSTLVLRGRRGTCGTGMALVALPHTTTLSQTLCHTQLCHTHTQLCHTPSFTRNFVTDYLSHTPCHTQLCHTQLCHTPSFTHTIFHTHLVEC